MPRIPQKSIIILLDKDQRKLVRFKIDSIKPSGLTIQQGKLGGDQMIIMSDFKSAVEC